MDPAQASKIGSANAELIAGGELDAADEFLTPGQVAHGTDRDLVEGPAAVRRYVRMLRAAFPDLAVEVEILVESGDRVAWQRTLTGTPKGPLMGFPAAHRRVVWRDMVTSRFEGSRIAEDWAVTDLAARLLLARKGRPRVRARANVPVAGRLAV